MHEGKGTWTDGDRVPTPAEIREWQRENTFLPTGEATPDTYPAVYNMSAGMLFGGVIRPVDPQLPDYVAIRMDQSNLEMVGQVSMWNMLWEAGQFRRRFFDENTMPPQIAKIADLGDINTIFVPRTASRYFEYLTLFHLLPRATVERFGLPLLRRGLWPFLADHSNIDFHLAPDFGERLANAWAWTVWPHLNSGSRLSAFSPNDPIRLLAHNLDYWVPPVTQVTQDILTMFPVVDKEVAVGPVTLEDGSVLAGALTGNPRTGGPIWEGEEDASFVVADTVEAADSNGQLRGILDAVRAHRVADDFSAQWSNAREDFERKMYRKRNKVQVRFVELTDTTPVQGPESEVLGNLVTNDFLALLDTQQREIVVLLSSGYRQHEIAERLGYANHSPISKKLAQVRRKAEQFFAES